MCEIEDLSLGHQDIYFNKYSDCFVSGTMDLYITDSLQDMLDMDIKSEMATDLGSGTDLSDTLGVSFSDLPPLLDMEMDNATTWIAGSNSSLHNSSNFVHNLDLYGSEANAVMVNPNSVMPSIFSESPIKSIVNQNSSNLMLNSLHSRSVSSSPSPSPTEEKSHLTFSPNTIKVCKVKQEMEEESIMSYGDLEPTSEGTNFVFIKRDNIQQIKKDLNDDLDGKPSKVNNPTIPSLRIKTSQPELVKLNRNSSILNTNQRLSGTQYVTTQTLAQKTFISSSIQIIGHQQSRTILANGNKNPTTILIDNGAFNNNKQVLKTSISSGSFNDNCSPKYVSGSKIALCGEFPKPAYSYSCLIAMALKNSRTGSLPVSEIYNFMCKHFPYFKTAPNGWKNSVRHNLSLNKCFEKIEKPSTNGGQRKGCLWAMNPSKVGKMDEEVQKWSRKDPQAIRKAMVRPDSLEALERGEMKYCNSEEATTADEDCSEDDLDVDELLQPEDQTTDVEVMETTFDEVDIEETIPLKLEFSLASQFHHAESPAKRAKASFLYQAVNTAPAHTNRRKTPLVNRIA